MQEPRARIKDIYDFDIVKAYFDLKNASHIKWKVDQKGKDQYLSQIESTLKRYLKDHSSEDEELQLNSGLRHVLTIKNHQFEFWLGIFLQSINPALTVVYLDQLIGRHPKNQIKIIKIIRNLVLENLANNPAIDTTETSREIAHWLHNIYLVTNITVNQDNQHKFGSSSDTFIPSVYHADIIDTLENYFKAEDKIKLRRLIALNMDLATPIVLKDVTTSELGKYFGQIAELLGHGKNEIALWVQRHFYNKKELKHFNYQTLYRNMKGEVKSIAVLKEKEEINTKLIKHIEKIRRKR